MAEQGLTMRWAGVGMLGVVCLAAVLVSTAGAASPSPSPSPSPIPQGCQLRIPQPADPLELNVAAVGRSVKVIAMEKEVFNCFDAQGTLIEVKDVETFIEMVGESQSDRSKGRYGESAPGRGTNERRAGSTSGIGGGTRPPIETTRLAVEAVTCSKLLRSGRVACGSDGISLGRTETPLTRCSPVSSRYPFPAVTQPADPVEMSTVIAGGLVTTVKVEKEIFDCAGQIGDLYLFTEIVEKKTQASFRIVARRFTGLICFKDESRGQLTQCRVFNARA
jgi:hypothetical protein